MGNYQSGMYIPLEEMSHLLLGRAVINLKGVISDSLERNIPLAFYSEYSEKDEDNCRLFIGRDYQRMDPEGKVDYRIELLENLIGGTKNDDGVETTSQFYVWEFSLVPPLREEILLSSEDGHRGLHNLITAYLIHQGQKENYSRAVGHFMENIK